MECVALSPSSSHFITDGKYTRFADWRFIHKARLNLVPLNGAQQWKTGVKATVIPFVVGALGSWYPPNDVFLRKFCAKSYLNLFRKLCVSDTIRWSRDIYIEHLTGHRQFSEDETTLTSQPVDQADE
ncbi:uncharacterized protein CDAR_27071 [Caerostris darwini]|uniref:Uncharacterized protein n=1 Tax=Caerostris darwini TaxID=1538125 RepID=A0AAV4TDR5_9ARAC|nr:uncharacterized protein CDAR_27071 [Caerostris darwini]